MIDKVSQKSALEIWRLGVRLGDARDVFGGTRVTAKIKNKAKQDASTATVMWKSAFEKMGAEWHPSFDDVESSLASFNEQSASETAKVQRLFERLQAGELIAVGFPIHEADASVPVQVPPFMLERRFAKWGQDSFVGLRRHYARVVVCEAPLPLPPATNPQPAKKRGGRPSFSDGLERVATALEKQGVSLDSRPWKTGEMHQLGLKMGIAGFSEKDPSAETIRRFLASRASSKLALKTQ